MTHGKDQLFIMTSKNKKLWTFLFSGVAVAALILLAAGLRDLEFSPGYPLPQREQTSEGIPGADTQPQVSKIVQYLYTGIYILVLLVMPLAIVYVIISPEARKRVLRSLALLLWLVAIVMLIRNRPELFQQYEMQPPQALPLERMAVPTVEFSANPPLWIVWATTVGFAVLIAAALVGVVWFIWHRSRRPTRPLEQLAHEAQGALDALHGGADLKDTIMRCYFEMSRVVSREQGIQRETAMTPREFERRLEEAGLPDSHVQQLTRLFEGVRYGAKVPGEREERQAIAALTKIVEACRSTS